MAPTARTGTLTPRQYARTLTLHRWHSQAQWQALDRIVTAESAWDSCAVYPSLHECWYAGSKSCGIPQAHPCPSSWRGRLATTWRQQCVWLIAYVAGRYGTPARALAFRQRNGWY